MKDKAGKLGASLIGIGFFLLVLRLVPDLIATLLVVFIGICTLLALLPLSESPSQEETKVEKI